MRISKSRLETLYRRYNRREYIHPDPLECLYVYERLCDREIAALVAACLAYGRVAQILSSVTWVLDRMRPGPAVFLREASRDTIRRTFYDFKHRFTTGRKLAAMLCGVGRALERFGSLQACFAAGLTDHDDTILPALSAFTKTLAQGACEPLDHLVPSPERGSACKRLNLFLRWMVRRDDVDLGGWEDVLPSRLLVPLDTHMHRICLLLGLTSRRQADLRTVMEVTDGFRAVAPDDPVKYDFALTRLGIRSDADLDVLMGRKWRR